MSKRQVETSRRPFTLGILGLFLLNLFLFGDVLFSAKGLVLSSSQTDLFLHFAAWRQFGFDQLRRGHLVLWNPHYLCGAPFFGNFESALLYPFNWLYLVLPLAPAINAGIVLHVFLAGLFTYLWAHHRGLHPLSCFIAGTVFMFGGAYFLHVFAGHLPNLCAMVWAPLIFLAIDGLVEGVSTGWILLGIFAVSMQILAGHPQYVYFTAIIAGFYTLLNLRGKKTKLKIAAGVAALYAGASLVTAVQLWTGVGAFLECARNSPLEFSKAASFSFPPQNLLTMILPGIFGTLSDGPYWSQWFLWEVSLFIGIGGFFLALTGVASGKPAMRKWGLTTAAIAFLFSLGPATPLYQWLYHFAPFFNGLRGVCKFDFLTGLFSAMLCGIGLDVLLHQRRLPRGVVSAIGLMGFIFFGLEILLMSSLDDGSRGAWGRWFSSIGWLRNSLSSMDPVQKERFLRDAGLHSSFSLFIGGCSCLFLSLLFFFQKNSRVVIYSVAGLAVLELFVFARSNRPVFELADLQNKFNQIQNVLRQDPGDYRVYGTGSASLATGGFDLWEDEPMVLGRYGRFVCYSQGLAENQLFSVLPIFSRFNRVFSMVRLKYLFSMDDNPRVHFVMPFKPLPRMLLTNQWQVLPDSPQILSALFDPAFHPGEKVYLEQEPNPVPEEGKPGGTVEWKDLSTDETEITAELPQASLLLVTDNYSRGWRGVALPGSAQSNYQVLPADYFLRAIPLSAGKHHFILEYRPFVFVLGKWVSIFSCLIYVGALILYFRKNPSFHG